MKGFIQVDYKNSLVLLNINYIIAVRTNSHKKVVIATAENDDNSSKTYILDDIYSYNDIIDLIEDAK